MDLKRGVHFSAGLVLVALTGCQKDAEAERRACEARALAQATAEWKYQVMLDICDRDYREANQANAEGQMRSMSPEGVVASFGPERAPYRDPISGRYLYDNPNYSDVFEESAAKMRGEWIPPDMGRGDPRYGTTLRAFVEEYLDGSGNEAAALEATHICENSASETSDICRDATSEAAAAEDF